MRASLRRLAIPLVASLAVLVPAGASPMSAPAALTEVVPNVAAASVPTPEQYFGFEMGTAGELARYPDMLTYFQLLAKRTDRLTYQKLGDTTLGNDYAMLTISSPKNLKRIDRLVEINRRLANPRGLSPAEAKKLSEEGRPFYLLFASIHSTEVGTGQAVPNIVHRLATENSADIKEILDNSVVLVVPSQNPDGQELVVNHWYDTKGTPYNRTYPDLYHKYIGHDDNRDWFMFTQKETQLAVQLQNKYKPVITHDMHQMGATGARMFVPPYLDPFDPNIHPLLVQATNTVGNEMAQALAAEGKEGVIWNAVYDYWTPARMYMVYHGQPRILTEIASVNLADTYVNPRGPDVPIGPQEPKVNFPAPYSKGTWTLKQIVDYGDTAAFAGMKYVARYHSEWLYNFYQVQRDWVNRDKGPYAFVIPADQRDPYATYELLKILQTAEVEIHRATAAFTSGGKEYPAGSWVVKLAQPFGSFAKSMLEKQVYPDLREYEGGPPLPPYDIAGHTLPMLMGVSVDTAQGEFTAALERVASVKPGTIAAPPPPKGAYLVGPESYGAFRLVSELQKAGVPTLRAADEFEAAGRTFAPGTFVLPPSPQARQVLEKVADQTGVPFYGVDTAPQVRAFELKSGTRVGLHRGANNIPGGWLMWLFEQYGINHEVVSAQDFEGDLKDKYDVIVLPQGMTKNRIINGLDPAKNPPEFSWAYGVGETGWRKLKDFVEDGGTLLSLGNSVAGTAELLDLPIEPVLPEDEKEFYSPGSLLNQEFDLSSPVAWGMPENWPVFFESDEAFRLEPGASSTVVSRYPDSDVLASGWLLGEDYIKGQANIISHQVGEGYVVTYGSQVEFRTWTRGTFKLIFNAMYHGPSTPVSAQQVTEHLSR
ncbi:M14 family metallopeptidase [Actinopolymorpha alba]|uniref:M14 family metallopeptidase n=1 Tax=Actinopolymorpha alba TaxID=533267 RepID=UPI00038093EA|nr:M14 family metallopeptidase [Actinopolymorpha alba]